MLPSILIVDDEQEVLKALERLLRKDYCLHLFTDPIEALEFYRASPTHIVISDMQMPKMNGAEFLKQVAELNLRSKRLVLTGFADLELAQKAINEGHVTYYLDKPWQNEELKEKLSTLITQLKKENRQYTAVKKLSLDKRKLIEAQQANSLLTDVLHEEHEDALEQLNKLKKINNELLLLNANLVSSASDEFPGHSLRVAQQAKALAKRLGLNELESLAVYLAGLFHRIGVIDMEDESFIFSKASVQERHAYQSYVDHSAEVMSTAIMLKASAEIVSQIFEQADGNGIPNQLTKDEISLGARILHTVILLDLTIHGQYNGNITEPAEAIEIVRKEVNKLIDGRVFNQLVEMLHQPSDDESFSMVKSVKELDAGMLVVQDVLDTHDHKILAENSQLTQQYITSLKTFQQQVSEPILVYVHSHKIDLMAQE